MARQQLMTEPVDDRRTDVGTEAEAEPGAAKPHGEVAYANTREAWLALRPLPG